MLRLACQIQIGDKHIFNYVTDVTIESSWDTFTDKAVIVLPNKFIKDNEDVIIGDNNIFKRGDRVVIGLGYFPIIKERFRGYIARIKPDSPLIIECEDRMWQLKQRNLESKTFVDTTIKEVVDYAAVGEDIDYDDPTAKIGTFQIDNKNFINSVDVFKVLKKNFGYKIYYLGDRLQVRALNSVLALDNPVHVLEFQHNIIQSNLEYQREDDLQIVIKAESIGADNKRIILYGFKDKGVPVVRELAKQGEMRSLKMYNVTKAQLKEQILRVIDNFIYEGYNGDVVTFLEPMVNHIDRLELLDRKHKERDKGRYLIKKVITNFGVSTGGRQTISLQNRIL